MQILVTKRFEDELKLILKTMLQQLDFQTTKNFKLYLDTIIINIPTKLHKYKTSQFFTHNEIKEIDYNGLKIFFYEEKKSKNIVLLSIS
jgi:hypothetical protein